jgi:glycosyltransferase involved in cell wall biosynthesis
MHLRILQICNKPPVPARDGGALAMLRMTEGLLEAGCTVHVLAIATAKHPWLPESKHQNLIDATRMDAVVVDTSVRWLPAFLSIFKSSSYNIDRFYSLGFEARLVTQLASNEYDIIQLESLYMAPYIQAIRRMSKAKIVLRAHNTESEIWKKYAEETSDTFKKIWFSDLTKKLAIYERKALSEVDAVIPITSEDEARLRAMTTGNIPFHTSTFAMKHGTTESKPTEPLTIFHIGAMDWKPNADGVDWLCSEVWPLVRLNVSGATLHLAGKGLDRERSFGEGIMNHGEVESASEFMSRYAIMAVPLHSGGGVKIKVIEAMFAGKPVVTTVTGSEGIKFTTGVDMFVADSAKEFADHLINLLNNPDQAEQIGAAAKKCAQENHELGRVTEKLCDFYSKLIQS